MQTIYYFVVLFLLCFQAFAAPLRAVRRDPERTANMNIVAVGASITFGTDSSDGYGYRKWMFSTLEGDGNNVNMIGTQRNGDGDNAMNEGYPGCLISNANQTIQNTWMKLQTDDGGTGYTPNVIVTLVGTNDCDPTRNSLAAITDAPNRYSSYLDTLRSLCPNCVIVASSLPPNKNAAWNQNIDYLNWYIQDIVAKRYAAGEKILFSDANGGLTVKKDISTVDGIHPDDSGYEMIGTRMAAQIQSAVNGGWVVTPVKF